jgi:phosphonate transport system permease protein
MPGFLTLVLLSLFGFAFAALLALANASMRRWMMTGYVGILIAFFAFPTTEVLGALSRETMNPTPAAVALIFPAFWLIAVSAFTGIIFFRRERLNAVIALVCGTVTLLVMAWWSSQHPSLVQLQPLNGLMEVLTALAFAAFVVLLTWRQQRTRWPGVALAVVVAILVFIFVPKFFPNSQGYYKVLRGTAASTEAEVVERFNQELPALNEQRSSIGLTELQPIETLTGLAGQRLPRSAAAEGLRLVQPATYSYGTPVIFLLSGLLLGAGLMLLLRPTLTHSSDLALGSIFAFVICILAPSFAATQFNLQKLIEGWPFLQDFLNRAWPPNPTVLQQVASQMLITIEIALIGTFLASLFAIPLSFLAARNLTQSNGSMRFLFALTRTFFNVDRGVDTLILALVFVAAVGLGPFAGILAMAIHSVADLGKLYSESIENVDRGPLEALESVGASGINVVRWAVLPQVFPLFLGFTLYRFEINFRVSIVLGLVGAGGIGYFIQEKMASGSYDQMVVAIIAIVIVVNIIDFASSWLRSRLV